MTDQELLDEIARLRAAAGAGGSEPYRVDPLPPEPDPTRGLSPEAAASAAKEEPNDPMIGAGRWTEQFLRGTKQGFLKGADMARPGDPDIRAAIAGFDADKNPDDKMAFDAYAKENPFATGVGEALPTLGIGGNLFTLPLKAGALGFMKEGNVDERLMNAGIEGLSAGVGNTLGRGAGGFLNPNLSRVERETLREGRARGVNPRLSQVTKSPSIERVEDWSARMPFGAGVMDDYNTANARGFNRTAAESMGQRPDAAGQLGPEVFAQAKRDIGAVFDQVNAIPNPGGVPPIVVGPNVAQAATNALHRQTMQLNPDATLTRIAQQALHATQNQGRMTGESYQALHHELTSASYNAFSAGDAASGRAYAALRDALDQAADTSLRQMGRPDLADSLRIARDQYGNFKVLETGRVAEAGNVSPPRVAQSLRTSNPDAFRTGRTDGTPLGFIGRWAELFPGLRSGSQTAERQAVQEAVTNPGATATVLAPIAAGAAKLTTSPAVTRIPATLGGTAAGRAAELAIEPTVAGSVQSYIRRFMRPKTP